MSDTRIARIAACRRANPLEINADKMFFYLKNVPLLFSVLSISDKYGGEFNLY
jgi:hypothetical protein